MDDITNALMTVGSFIMNQEPGEDIKAGWDVIRNTITQAIYNAMVVASAPCGKYEKSPVMVTIRDDDYYFRCPDCKRAIVPNQKYCSECGLKFNWANIKEECV